ncbi:MAG: metal-dependent hydrolase [Candidatus Magnetominusculus sp. LBB02]|nr:metal-dependent hydrolase [Candidatus Magnetominusculus sp. LBB02]
MIAGHIACSYVAQRLLRLRPVNNAFLLAASYLPDIIDKTLSIVFSMPGRGFFHSFAVMFGLYGFSYMIVSKVRADYAPLVHLTALYYALHLIFDFPKLNILFWPFLGPINYEGHFSPIANIYSYYIGWRHPEQLISETAFFAILIIIKIRDMKPLSAG